MLLVGQQEGHLACKKYGVMRCCRGYLSGARCKWFALLQQNPQNNQNGLSFWYRPTQVVLEKRPLNDCVCVCVSACILCFCFILHNMLYYCEHGGLSTWWDWILVLRTHHPSVLWHCWLGHLTRKKPPHMTYNVFGRTLKLAQLNLLTTVCVHKIALTY